MIMMALDHMRDYFGIPGGTHQPRQTTVPLFFTRWITHFCAPVFFLLTGTGAFLARSTPRRALVVPVHARTVADRSGAHALPLPRFPVQFRLPGDDAIVVWALGWAMIVLAALVWLPRGDRDIGSR